MTGTCHELRFTGEDNKEHRVLLDCGLFQGKRAEAAEKNAKFAFDPAKDIEALILSHAHMDHVGRVPVLWKRGFRGRVHCTYATKDLAHVMMMDGGYIQEKDEEFFRKHVNDERMQSEGPLYTQEDGDKCIELFEGRNYEDWFQVCPGLRAKFYDAGHVLGAAMVLLEVSEPTGKRMIGFSGDLGRSTLPIIRDPSAMPPVDTLICESTYGNRMHGDLATAKDKMKEYVLKTAKRGGKVIIPAFSLERTQQLVYDLHLLWDSKQIPAIPIIIDSPLASKVTDVFMKHPECYDKEMYEQFLARGHNPFQFSLVRYTDSVDESKALNGRPGPMVLMAGSGMCEAGRIRHHLKNELEDERNLVLAVGFMAQYTLGARIIDPEVREVKIFNQTVRKRAEVQYIDAYSGHADAQDLDAYVDAIQGLKQLILVHGEPAQMDPFAERLKLKGKTVFTPNKEEAVTI